MQKHPMALWLEHKRGELFSVDSFNLCWCTLTLPWFFIHNMTFRGRWVWPQKNPNYDVFHDFWENHETMTELYALWSSLLVGFNQGDSSETCKFLSSLSAQFYYRISVALFITSLHSFVICFMHHHSCCFEIPADLKLRPFTLFSVYDHASVAINQVLGRCTKSAWL